MTDERTDLAQARRELVRRRLRAAEERRGARDGEIGRRDPELAEVPASFAQQRLWYLDQVLPGRAIYNIPYRLRLSGRLDEPALRTALTALVGRHEALRTTFPAADGTPRQHITPPGEFPLPVDDLTAVPAGHREDEAASRMAAEADAPFDLARGPLVRGHLLRLAADDHLLLLTVHHIVVDGWSFRVLFEELAALYSAARRGVPAALAPAPVQYGDYAVWEQRRAATGELDRDLDHWRMALADVPGHELPTDFPRPRELSGAGRRIRVRWDGELAAAAAGYARDAGVTLYTVLVAGLAALLGRHTGQSDQVIGAAVGGRTRAEVEDVVGLFVNTLVLRVDTGEDPALDTLVRRAQESIVAAFAHQETPFDRVVDALRVPREATRNPLFQVMVSMQHVSHVPRAELDGLAVDLDTVDTDIAKFDLTFVFTEATDHLLLEVEYSTDLFAEETVRTLVDRCERLVRALVTRPDARLSDVDLLTGEERGRLLELSRGPSTASTTPSVAAAVDRWVRAAPDATAVSFGGRRLSYLELDRWANRVAHRLTAAGVGDGARVGLCAERSAELVVGMLAAAKVGAAYVPLDPALPAERLRFLADDADVAVLLHTPGTAGVLPPGPVPRLALDAADDQPATAPATVAGPDHLLYLMYTSGTTGRPKGVCVTHRAVLALVENADFAPLSPGDVVAQAANASFDAATFEIWGALCNGAEVVGVDQETLLSGRALRDHLTAHRVSCMYVPAALLGVLVRDTPDVFAGLGTLVFGGEAADPSAVRAVLRKPPGRLVNGYGPTETTTFAVAMNLKELHDDATAVPLGRPICNTHVYVVDEAGRLAPPGAEGELWIGGPGVARGYWNRPDLTERRFVPDPLRPGERVYRTGDRVRWHADGTLEFHGRFDDQVKIRGFRVEPTEVAAVLTEHPDVRDAVVLTRRDTGQAALVAYVVSDGLTAGALRRYAAGRLPEYLVPAAVVLLDELPLNANGKLDRAALPAPRPPESENEYREPPATPVEAALAETWCELLGRAEVGRHDDFFALGGHSLLVTRLVSAIERRLGVRLTVREVFDASVLARLAEVVAGRPAGGAAPARDIPRAPRDEPLPLSFAQQRLWFLDRLVPDSPLYNIADAYEVRGRLSVEALREAVAAVVARHESLRTTFVERDGTPWQVVHDSVRTSLSVVDVGDAARARELVRAEAERPFDLERGPLVRVVVLRTGKDRAWLAITMHHIVSDGWSIGLLLDELSQAYEAARHGRPAPLPELSVQYADFAAWQRTWLRSEVLEAQRDHWVHALAGMAELELPLDRPRPPVQSHAGATTTFTVPPSTADVLRRWGREGHGTLFMVLFGAFATLLSRLSGQTDVAVGCPIANRNHAHTEKIIGFFVNTLVLRVDLAGDPTFADVVDRVREAALSGYANQDLPFEHVVEMLRPERDLSRNPLVQVTFQVLDDLPGAELAGLELRRFTDAGALSQFDLSVDVFDGPDGLQGWVNHSTDLFDESTVEGWVGGFLRLLDAVAANPALRTSELSLVGDAERRELVAAATGPRVEVPDRCAHQLFEHEVRRRPHATALVHRDVALTFAELNARANRLARRLRAAGVRPGTRVGLCLPRGTDVVTAVLAVWKAGAAYVPIDPGYPQERCRFLAHDARLGLLLVAARPPSWVTGGVPTIDVHADLAHLDGDDLDLPTAPESLAYVIYTSGSTGTPKGVAITHGSVVNLAVALRHGFGAGSPAPGQRGLRVAHTASFSFDASVEQLSWMLTGDEVHVVDDGTRRDLEALVGHVRTARLDVLDTTATQLELLMSLGLFDGSGWAPGWVMVGGEPVGPALWSAMRAVPATRFFNLYGPTECTVDATIQEVGAGADRPAIGRPLANTSVYVVDRAGHLVPPGVVGELWLGGAGVARGYWDRDDLTADRFFDDPFRPGGRVYRSGDLGRRDAAGVLEFHGRADDQVKIRGFRIEPGEVAAALAAHPGVRDAVVVCDDRGPARLIAYVVPAGDPMDPDALLRFAAGRLPEFMVPAAVVPLAGIPLNQSGKLDRAALPSLADADREEGKELVAPRTGTEEVLAEIWAEVLGRERVGAFDNFFALGGHSLLVTQVVSRLETRLGKRLPLRVVFEAATLDALARAVDEHDDVAGARVIGRVPRDATMPVSFAQQRLWILDRLVPGSAFYNMPDGYRVCGPLDLGALRAAVDSLVARHETLRTTFTQDDGQPRQVIHPHATVPVEVADVSGVAEAEALAAADALRSFDLETGPLLRVTVLRLAPDDAVLLLTIHHIVSDGWSSGVLLDELSRAYESAAAGRDPGLPEPVVQYADFAVWQRRWLEGPALAEQQDHWLRTLAGSTPTELPADHPRPATQSHRGATVSFEVPAGTADALRQTTLRSGTTLFTTLYAAFAALLARLTGESDIAVGCPIANRNHAHTEQLIGFFVNTLVLRTSLDGDPAFTDLVARAREVALAGFANQDLPFEHVVEVLRPERDLSRNPLAQITFQLLNNADPELGLAGCAVTRLERGADTSRFDLSLDMVDEPGRLWGWVNFSTDLFDKSTVEGWVAAFRCLLDAVAANPALRVSELPLVDETRRRHLLAISAGPVIDTPGLCAHHLFERETRRRPHATALVHDGTSWTFAELNARANRLARRLRADGIVTGGRVGLCLPRGADLVTAVLAVWKAGAAYIPVDPAYPQARRDLLLADTAPSLVLDRIEDRDGDGADLDLPVRPTDLAYVIHTSGSTGTPKGVPAEHGSVVNLMTVLRQELGVPAAEPGTPAKRVAHTASFSFDASVDQLSWMLHGGLELHLVTEETRRDSHQLVEFVRAHAVDILNVTPSQLEVLFSLGLFDGEHRAPGLVMVGGEEVGRALWSAMRAVPGTRFVNLYGPTECTVDATVCAVGDSAEPSIGRPIGNAHVYVVDAAGDLAPVGGQGEIWIGGTGTARGYWNRPELTARHFLADPFRPGGRVYRTGDLGRWRPDGTLEFRGRADAQVKVRGFRIEPGEVEAALRTHPRVRETAVVARRPSGLVAYVVPERSPGDDAARDQVEEWRSVFETTNAERADGESTFDVSGWISSVTGRPLPASEMGEWVRGTVDRIRALRPRRVLEIGVGTGLLLWRLAPDCDTYVGTDFSAGVLATLSERLRERPVDGVSLLQRDAVQLDEFGPGSFDCVIVNSVVQYFPGAGYLRRVLDGALRVLRPSGHVFVGDVRHLGLLDAFHHDVALARSGDDSPDQLRAELGRQRGAENEFVLSPRWFEDFARENSLGVAVAPKTGAYDNELVRYRYDVVLSTEPGEPDGERPPADWRDATRHPISLAEAEAELVRTGRLNLTRVPNRLVRESARAAARLTGTDDSPATAGPGALSANDLAELAAAHGLPVAFSWRADHPEGAFDVAVGPGTGGFGAPADPTSGPTANDPTSAHALGGLGAELKRHLADRLPEHLVPGAVLLVPELPLTVGGKLDEGALPPPAPADGAPAGAPRTPTEHRLAAIWGEVLNVATPGVGDNFFTLGGNSLVATRIVARAAGEGIRLSLKDLFQNQTLDKLAALCDARAPRKDA